MLRQLRDRRAPIECDEIEALRLHVEQRRITQGSEAGHGALRHAPIRRPAGLGCVRQELVDVAPVFDEDRLTLQRPVLTGCRTRCLGCAEAIDVAARHRAGPQTLLR